MSNETLWYLSRATGLASVVLLTLVVVSSGSSPAAVARSANARISSWACRWLLGMFSPPTHRHGDRQRPTVSIDWISLNRPFTQPTHRSGSVSSTLAFDLLVAVPPGLAGCERVEGGPL